MSLFEKEEIKIENILVKRKENENNTVLRYRDWAISFLKNQVRLRDNVLFKQKMMIDRGGIDAQIPYTGLKQVQNIAEREPGLGDDLVLPRLNTDPRKRARSRYRGKPGPSSLSSRTRGNYGLRSRFASSSNLPRRGFSRSPRAAYNSKYRNLPRISSYSKGGYNRPRQYYARRPGGNNKKNDLPEYLKNRIVYQRKGNGVNNQHSSLKDKSLSYQRRLQKAIFDRDNKFGSRAGSRNISRFASRAGSRLGSRYTSRVGSRIHSRRNSFSGRPAAGYGRPRVIRRNFGYNYRSQPNLKPFKRRLNYGRHPKDSPYVQSFLKRGLAGQVNGLSGTGQKRMDGALKLLKKKSPTEGPEG